MNKYICQLVCLALVTLSSTASRASFFPQWGSAMTTSYVCQAAASESGLSEKTGRTYELMRSAMIYTNEIMPFSVEDLKMEAARLYGSASAQEWMVFCAERVKERDWDIYMDITDKFDNAFGRMEIGYRFIHVNLACQKFYQLLTDMRHDTRHTSALSEYMQGQTDEKWSAIDQMKSMHAAKLDASRFGKFSTDERHQYWAAQLVDVGLHFPELNWLGQYTVSGASFASNLSNMTRSCIGFLDLSDK